VIKNRHNFVAIFKKKYKTPQNCGEKNIFYKNATTKLQQLNSAPDDF